MAELGEEVFSQVHTYDLTNVTAASLLLTQIIELWLIRLGSKKSYPAPDKPAKRVRPFLRLHEFDEDEFKFHPDGDEGKLDEEGLPHGKGLLRFEVENQESCVGNACEGTLYGIKGNFDHGSLLGFADVYYTNGEVLRGNFAKGSTLHGVVTKLNKDRQIMSVANYESGVRSGPTWQMEPEYGVLLYGQASPKEKGKINGDDALLCYFSNSSDAFALTGEFQDGILQGQGYPKRLAKAWFSDDGFMMYLEAAKEGMKFDKDTYYNFRAGAHLVTQEDRFLAQAAWLWMQRCDETEPKATVKDQDSIDAQFRDDVNVTMLMPDSDDTRCAKLSYLDHIINGAVRDRWLACYPGSGSKWLLTVIRASTGLTISGVIGGIFGQYEMGSTMLVKTHHQNPDRWKQVFSVLNKHESRMWSRWSEDLAFRMRDIQFMKGRAIILFRNPYDTMISFWNHDRTGTYDGGRNKDGLKDLGESLKTDLFKDFVKNEMKLWEEIYMDYLTAGSHLLAVHYEDMKKDMAAVQRDIINYLELPVDEERIECSLKLKHDKIKRKSRELEDPFDQELRDVIEGVIDRVQEMLKFRKLKPLPVEKYKWRKAKP